MRKYSSKNIKAAINIYIYIYIYNQTCRYQYVYLVIYAFYCIVVASLAMELKQTTIYLVSISSYTHFFLLSQDKFNLKEWDPSHSKLKAQTLKRLAEFEAQHPPEPDRDLVRCL